jgi:alanine transaminase
MASKFLFISNLFKIKNSNLASVFSLDRCGSRGGYYELINLNKDVRMQVNKFVSAGICSTVWGQVVMDAIINPPKDGEPSYKLYKKERSDVLNRLKEKACLITNLFNSVEGVHCNPVTGSVVDY